MSRRLGPRLHGWPFSRISSAIFRRITCAFSKDVFARSWAWKVPARRFDLNFAAPVDRGRSRGRRTPRAAMAEARARRVVRPQLHDFAAVERASSLPSRDTSARLL